MSFDPNEHLIKLKGKDYLEVKWRLVWFREQNPSFTIDTALIAHDRETQHAIFRAAVSDAEGRLLSTGYGSECIRDFRDYIEKAETKAVGRALAMLGYGTQFAPELEEGERIVDSPIAPKGSVCEVCGAKVTQGVVTYCENKLGGKILCPSCQGG
jgi:hypothetical protein